MNVNVMTLAELAGIVCVLVGGYIIANVGGLVLGLGAVLLYEVRP